MTRKPGLGLWMCTALVIGNMIGSGVFLLPAALAPFGGISILGWLVSAGGALCLALVFARLSAIMPRVGGPYAYAREGFGDFAGFWVAAHPTMATTSETVKMRGITRRPGRSRALQRQ